MKIRHYAGFLCVVRAGLLAVTDVIIGYVVVQAWQTGRVVSGLMKIGNYAGFLFGE